MAKIAKAVLTAAAAMTAAVADKSIANIPTADLLKFYLEHAERFGMKPVKKFADRGSAETRVADLAAAITAASTAEPIPKAKKVAEGEGAAAADLSAAVAATWNDPDVRAARAARYQVQVGKDTYGSVRKAFAALGLPDNKHVAFRGQLAKAGTGEFNGHKFKVVPAAA